MTPMKAEPSGGQQGAGRPGRRIASAGSALSLLALLATAAPAAADERSSGQNPFIAITAAQAEDQEVLDVPLASAQAPALLAKTGTGVPLAVRYFLRKPVPDSSNYFTESGAGTYVDGVYFGRPFGGLYDYIDIDRINVIPTAQGTAFGRNTIDGAVLITTKQPGLDFAATADLTYGSYNWFDARGAISGPLVEDKLAASVSGVLRRRDGLVDAPALAKDVNDRDFQEARAKLLFTPSEALDVTLSIDGLHDRSSPKYPSALAPFAPGQDAAARPGRDVFRTEAVTPDLNRLDQAGLAIVANYRLEDLALKSITAYRDIAATSYVTYDATQANVLSTESFVHQNHLSEDLNVSAGDDALRGTAGFYFFRKDTKQNTPTGASPNFSREFTYGYAGYAQGQATIATGLELVAGLRYAVEDKNFSSDFYAGNRKATRFGKSAPVPASALSPQSDADSWYGLTPHIGIDYRLTQHLLAYFAFTEGFKSGGWNNRLPPDYDQAGNLDVRPRRYLPERSEEYEIGLKLDVPEERLQVDFSAYIHDYRNLQIPVYLYNSSTSYLTTAPGAEITGIEIDPTWRATDELQFYGLVTLQHGNYRDGPFLCQDTAGASVDCSARKLIGLAPLRALAGFVYTPKISIPGQFRFGLSVDYSDKYQNSVAGVDLAATGSRTLLDASVNYQFPDKHWSLSLEGRNLTDVHWFSTAAQNGTAVAVYPDDPRIILFRVRYRS